MEKYIAQLARGPPLVCWIILLIQYIECSQISVGTTHAVVTWDHKPNSPKNNSPFEINFNSSQTTRYIG